jgi:hypothetical protein
MVTFMFFCVGLAACIVGGLICFAMAKTMKGTPVSQLSPEDRVAWNQIKIAMMDLYSRYETKETPAQRSLRSWAGTLVICAGLCLIGVVLEVEFDQRITMDNVFAGFLGPQSVSTCLKEPHIPQPRKLHAAHATPTESTQPATPTAPTKEQPVKK